jgi:long-chain acyl-CoA synthetase
VSALAGSVIARAWHEVAIAHADRVALIEGKHALTYGDLHRRTRVLAARLQDLASVRPGDCLAVMLPNSVDFAAAFFAAQALGGVVLPLNPAGSDAEMARLAVRCGVRVLITRSDARSHLDPEKALPGTHRVLLMDEGMVSRDGKGHSAPFEGALDGNQAAVYLTTSGSTGRPKIVPRTGRNLLANARAMAAALAVGVDDRFLSVVPFWHANGLANCLLLPLLSGASLLVRPRYLPREVLSDLAAGAANLMIGSPFIYATLAAVAKDAADLGRVRTWLSSGAALPPQIAGQMARRFGVRIREQYGSSETGSIGIADAETDGQSGGCRPLPHQTLRIVGEDGRRMPQGESGEIRVRGPAVFPGYLDDAGATARAFDAHGLFRTGDIGYLGPTGELHLVGRRKRFINVAGVKVDPTEVQRVLEAVPSVERARVYGRTSPQGIEQVEAVVVSQRQPPLTTAEILAHCRRQLAEFKIPRRVDITRRMPDNLLGKAPVAR